MGDSFIQEPLDALGHEYKLLAGSFATNGASNPVATTITGVGIASVVLTATGKYTVTFTDSYNGVISAVAGVRMTDDSTDLYAQIGAIDVVTAKTMVIKLKTGSSNTNLAAAAGSIVDFTLIVKDSDYGS